MNLNSSNRLVRTRMLGGVAGAQSHRLPPMPIGQLVMCLSLGRVLPSLN